jgi:hypothetical protein
LLNLFVLPSLYLRFGKSKDALPHTELASVETGAAEQIRIR